MRPHRCRTCRSPRCPKAMSRWTSAGPRSTTRTAWPSPARGASSVRSPWSAASTSRERCGPRTRTSGRPGDEVVVTGWGLSETHPGGYTTRQRVRSRVAAGATRAPHPARDHGHRDGGTDGHAVHPGARRRRDRAGTDGEVLVTGAGGGVGSFAVMLLANLGYRVAAATGRPEIADYLTELGAASIVGREELSANSGRPLEKERWSAAIDTVGSQTLATVLAQTRYRGAVAACGLAGRFRPADHRPLVHSAQRQTARGWTPCRRPRTSARPPGPAWTPTSPVTCSIWSPPRSHWPASRPWPNRSWRVRCAVGS